MDKAEHQGEMLNYNMGRNISIMIRRPYIYEDAFEKLSLENGEAVFGLDLDWFWMFASFHWWLVVLVYVLVIG